MTGIMSACLPLLVMLCSVPAVGQSIYTVAAPPGDGSSTGLRVPNGTRDHAYFRTVTFVDGPNLKLLPSGTKITRLGFVAIEGAGMKVAGNLSVYLSNAFSSSPEWNVLWTEVIGGMTKVYEGPFTVPDSAGPVDFDLSTPFTYTGRSLYVAYDFRSAGPFTSKNAVYSSNVARPTMTYTAFSATELPQVLTDVSDYRPVIRFRFPIPALQWSPVASGIQNDLTGLDIVDEDFVWASAPSGNVFSTTDRGRTWLAAGSVPDSVSAIVGFTNQFAAIIAGKESDTSHVYVTSDGGGTWNLIESRALTLQIGAAGKTSTSALWCLGTGVGDSVKALTSYDRGRSWAQSMTGLVLAPGARISRTSAFRIGNAMWFGTRGSGPGSDRVYKSSSGPSGPWRYSSTGRANLGVLAFSSASGTGIAAHIGCTDTIRRSTDGGLSWSKVIVAGFGEVSALQYFAGGQDAWAATSTGVWHSADDGFTWQKSFSAGGPPSGISCLRFTSSFQNALAVGSGGLVVMGAWAKNNPTEVADISTLPSGYSLGANYPNPFNSSTWIEFSVPSPSFVTLKMIDILGREVATIVSGEKGTGKYKAEWKAGKNPSGVYFYRLHARPLSGSPQTDYVETHRLILLK